MSDFANTSLDIALPNLSINKSKSDNEITAIALNNSTESVDKY